MKHCKIKNPLKKLYLLLILIFMYEPIAVMIVFSFNESRQLEHWTELS